MMMKKNLKMMIMVKLVKMMKYSKCEKICNICKTCKKNINIRPHVQVCGKKPESLVHHCIQQIKYQVRFMKKKEVLDFLFWTIWTPIFHILGLNTFSQLSITTQQLLTIVIHNWWQLQIHAINNLAIE